jgi:hypothetical protein
MFEGMEVVAGTARPRWSKELIPALYAHFAGARILAYNDKLFPDLAEDCWLLVCQGYGGRRGSRSPSPLCQSRAASRTHLTKP